MREQHAETCPHKGKKQRYSLVLTEGCPRCEQFREMRTHRWKPNLHTHVGRKPNLSEIEA